MPTITVTVYQDDEPASGLRVVLGVGAISGVTDAEYTDSDGMAVFELDYEGSGDVYVNGSIEGHWSSRDESNVDVYL